MVYKTVTGWRNSYYLCARMVTKDILLASFAAVLRGYGALIRHWLIPYGLLVGTLLYSITQQTTVRMLWWIVGYNACIILPFAVVLPQKTAWLIALIETFYLYQWALATRASIGKKDQHYFYSYHLCYWRVVLTLCCLAPIIMVYATTSVRWFFMKEFFLEASTIIYAMAGMYGFFLCILLWMVSWFVFYALDDVPCASWGAVLDGFFYFIWYNLPIGFFLVISTLLWSLVCYGSLWLFIQAVALFFRPIIRAVPIITAVWSTTLTIVYPCIIAWLYTGYVLTRYERSDRYVLVFGDN